MHGEHVLGLYDIGGHEKVRMRYLPVPYHIAGGGSLSRLENPAKKKARQRVVCCPAFFCRIFGRIICAFSGDGSLVDAVDGALQNLVELGVALACAKILGEGA